MNEFNLHKEMISQVATALGEDLLDDVVFVGGCITGLLLTDDFTRDQVRHTDDVDLIVDLMTLSDLAKFEKKLRHRGFTNNIDEGAHIGSWKLNELHVDIIPINPKLLASAQGWCEEAYHNSHKIQIGTHSIRLAQPVFFVAMKLEAYEDRGKNDPLESRDIEDVLNLFDGRDELIDEIKKAPHKLKQYISNELTKLFRNEYFNYAIQSAALSDANRETLLIKKLKLAMEIE